MASKIGAKKKMKITGKVDTHDQIAWINWVSDHRGHGYSKWKGHLFLWPALAIPPLVFWLTGGPFHWGTYLGVIFCWLLYFCLWRFLMLLIERGSAKKEEPTTFEIDRMDDIIRLHVQGHAFEIPAIEVSAVHLRANAVLTVKGMPVCITPRNGNFDEGKTIEDVLELVTGRKLQS